MRNVPKTPPMKNPITAIKEPKLSNDNPVMAWPDVHPLAYLEPKPMHNPPKEIISISFPNVHVNLEEENWMKVGHEQNDWNEVDEPYLEVFVTSWHQLAS
jgi:hypothetical protein